MDNAEEMSKLVKTVTGAVPDAPPMTNETYEKFAKAFDTELVAYTSEHDSIPSLFAVFHKPCLERLMQVVKSWRKANPALSFQMEGIMTVETLESHLITLFKGSETLPAVQLAFNRALWQGANCLMSMALCLRPKSMEWMDCAATWSQAAGGGAAAIALLQVMRVEPDMGFSNPNDTAMTPGRWDEVFVSKYDKIAVRIVELCK